MNRKARKMTKQHRQGKPTTGRPGCPIVIAALAFIVAVVSGCDPAMGHPDGSYLVPFQSCAEASAAGDVPLRRDDPRYSSVLDADGDGVACE